MVIVEAMIVHFENLSTSQLGVVLSGESWCKQAGMTGLLMFRARSDWLFSIDQREQRHVTFKYIPIILLRMDYARGTSEITRLTERWNSAFSHAKHDLLFQ